MKSVEPRQSKTWFSRVLQQRAPLGLCKNLFGATPGLGKRLNA